MSERRFMRLRGGDQGVTRYRADKENTGVHLYLDVQGEHTLADLIATVAEQGVRPTDVTFRGGCFVLTIPASAEDVAKWEQFDADRDARAKESRRQWYERLRSEFGEEGR